MTTAAIVALIGGDPEAAFALWQRLDQRVWARLIEWRECENIHRKRDLYRRYKRLQELREQAWTEALR